MDCDDDESYGESLKKYKEFYTQSQPSQDPPEVPECSASAAAPPATATGTNQPKRPSSSAPPKPVKKQKKVHAPVSIIKRDQGYRQHPTKHFIERQKRAMEHPMILFSRKCPVQPKEQWRVYYVGGTTGNMYEVRIDAVPSCTCIDYIRQLESCKHVIYVMQVVLHMAENWPGLWQKSLSETQLIALIDADMKHYGDDGNDGTCENQNQNQNQNQVVAVAQAQAETGGNNGIVDKDPNPLHPKSKCPVCWYNIYEEQPSLLEHCRLCGENMHRACLSEWMKLRRASKFALTCPRCNQEWQYKTIAAPQSRPSLQELYPDTYMFCTPGLRMHEALDLHREKIARPNPKPPERN